MTQQHAKFVNRTWRTCLLDGGATVDSPPPAGQLAAQPADMWGTRCPASTAGALGGGIGFSGAAPRSDLSKDPNQIKFKYLYPRH